MTRKELKEKYDKPIDRIKHMSNVQILIRTFFMFAFLTIISSIIYVMINGIPVLGVPSKSKIVQAEITAPRLTEETVVVTDEVYIEYARNIVSYLGTELKNETPENPGEPYVSIKYTTKNGKVCEISANEEYVFFNGKIKPLKKDVMFVAIAEGVFFPELTQYTTIE